MKTNNETQKRTQATARPWRIEDFRLAGVNIKSSEAAPCTIAQMQMPFPHLMTVEENAANAALIVEAVNQFDSLKSELCKERTENLLLKQQHAALVAVAESAQRALKLLAPSLNPSEDSIFAISRSESQQTKNQIENALAALELVRKEGR